MKLQNLDENPVKSDVIANIGHDGESTLIIRFKASIEHFTPASVYSYQGVSADLFEAFKKAQSKGTFFRTQIKGKFSYQRVNN